MALEIPKRDPLKALPLVNLYLQMEDYQAALDLLYRAEPFMTRGSFSIRQSIEEIERALELPQVE